MREMSSIRIRRRPPPKISNNASLKARSPILPIHSIISRQGRHNPRSAVGAALVTACVLLACWICLKVELSKVEEEEERRDLAHLPSLRRISSSDHANFTQLFPCINDVSIPPFTEIEPILTRDRKKSRSPSFDSLSCAPPNKNMCFRGVYDGFDDLVSDAHKDHPDVHSIFSRIAVLFESLILHPEAPLSPEILLEEIEPTLLEPAVEKLNAVRRQKTTTLHSDYFETDKFVYTAILYDEPPKDLLGGETALVDFIPDGGYDFMKEFSSMEKVTFGMKIWENKTAVLSEDEASTAIFHNDNQPVEFTSGMIVEPKLGRLLLFSGGGENFHAPLEVKRGYRPSYIFWFKCKNQIPIAEIR